MQGEIKEVRLLRWKIKNLCQFQFRVRHLRVCYRRKLWPRCNLRLKPRWALDLRRDLPLLQVFQPQLALQLQERPFRTWFCKHLKFRCLVHPLFNLNRVLCSRLCSVQGVWMTCNVESSVLQSLTLWIWMCSRHPSLLQWLLVLWNRSLRLMPWFWPMKSLRSCHRSKIVYTPCCNSKLMLKRIAETLGHAWKMIMALGMEDGPTCANVIGRPCRSWVRSFPTASLCLTTLKSTLPRLLAKNTIGARWLRKRKLYGAKLQWRVGMPI